MTHILYIILTILPSLVPSVNIWTSLMNGEGFSEWTIEASNNPTQMNNDNNCPDNDDCWRIDAQDLNSNQQYIYRMAPTTGYNNIKLTFNLKPRNMQDNGEKCSLRYSINNEKTFSSFTEFFTASGNDNFVTETFSLPSETADNSNIGIMILALDSSGDYCYGSDFILTGDVFTYASSPTPSPLIYRGIEPGTFKDNYELAPNRGWLINYSPTAHRGAIITTSNDTNLTYHGPYIGDTTTTYFEVYNISQKFYCTENSSVDVTYYVYFCNSEQVDTLTFYLNNIAQSMITMETTSGSAYTDIILSSVPPYCTAGWRYIAMGPYTIPEISYGLLFEVKFKISTDFENDAIAVSRTQITCTPLPTISPTKAPTYFPTITPTNNPSISPTNYPSLSPSYIPSISPTKITINPTLIPSNNPSVSPTNNPTITPTINPSQQPTKLPSIFPTKLPTTPEPTLRIEFIAPTFGPTKSESPQQVYSTNVTQNTVVEHTLETNLDKNALDSMMVNNIIFIMIGILFGCCLCCLFCVISRRQKKNNDNKRDSKIQIQSQSNGMNSMKSSDSIIDRRNNIQMVSTDHKPHLGVINGHALSFEQTFERVNSGSVIPSSITGVTVTNLSMDDVIDLHIASIKNVVSESVDQQIDVNEDIIHIDGESNYTKGGQSANETNGYVVDTESSNMEGTPEDEFIIEDEFIEDEFIVDGADEFIIGGDDEEEICATGYGDTKSGIE